MEILAVLQGCCGLETTALKNHFSEKGQRVSDETWEVSELIWEPKLQN